MTHGAALPNIRAVHLSRLRLRDFRNYARLDADFQPGFHLFLGDNAQGKSNLLEAIYLVATLRSFRGVGSVQMVRHGHTGYFIGAGIQSEAAHDVRVYWSAARRNLTLDGQPVRRYSDYLGVLRAVIFSNDDLQLVKGPASRRRRFLDLLLTQTRPGYLALLQRYTLTLRSRNALLKRPHLDEVALEGFSRELVDLGNQIIQRRRELSPTLALLAQQAYGRIAGDTDAFCVEYHSSVRSDFQVELAQSRGRERFTRSTSVGPHRDELRLRIQGQAADAFASEGQMRSIAIALKMAQAEYLMQTYGSPPVLLIDDIMGELDARRRSGLIPLLQRVDQAGSQVFLTATEETWPRELGHDPQRWEIKTGTMHHRSKT